MKISIIITTYNRPSALSIVLRSLFKQTILPDEIIIADDGSNKETQQLLESLKAESPCLIKHVWQPDQGFRAAKIRNKASIQATGDYLIFLDGDSAVFPDFVQQHKDLAEPNWFVAGNRILLNETLTKKWEEEKCAPLLFSTVMWIIQRIIGNVNRLLPLIRLCTKAKWRKKKPTQWEGAKTCNLGIWHEDFVQVNGFDEAFQGWGHEDADLVIRLLNRGIFRKEGRFAVPTIHLWHTESPRDRETENWLRLQKNMKDKSYKEAEKGIKQHED